jgi:hypothetical protein
MDRTRPHTSVICTLGMHRSGTSMVSRMLNLLGVHLGPEERVLTSREDNPKGFWEYRPFVDINDEILARFGGCWDEPPAFPPSWWRDPNLADLREKVRHLMTEDFAVEPLWGWKDPRACLTLPFWQDLIGPMRYLVCVRNPCAVVASLARRDGMTGEKADRLWCTHVQAALADTTGQPRMFVFYEDIIDDWLPELRRMAAFTGNPEPADDPRVRQAVGDFLESGMCHHRMSTEDLLGDQRISLPSKGLYLAVRGHASPRNLPAGTVLEQDRVGRTRHKTLDLLGPRALDTGERTPAVATEFESLGLESRAQTATIAALIAERDGLVAERARLVAERDDLAARSSALGEKAAALSAECSELVLRETRCLQTMASLETGLRAMTLDRDRQAQQSEALLRALREVQTSCTWMLVTFAREIIVPAGTRRRRVVNSILRRLARRLPAPRVQGSVVDRRAA